jgi:hypothetical protein
MRLLDGGAIAIVIIAAAGFLTSVKQFPDGTHAVNQTVVPTLEHIEKNICALVKSSDCATKFGVQ